MRKSINLLLAVILVLLVAIILGVTNYFTQNGKTLYRCPNFLEYQSNEGDKWINCAPKIGQTTLSIYCEKDYQDWLVVHCADITIAQ